MSLTKSHTARTVDRLSFNGRTDIIIPFHGVYDTLARGLESILRFTFSSVYHVYVVDDASPNAEFVNSLAKIPNVTCVRNERQLGFGGALRRGFERSTADDDRRKEANQPDHPYVVCFQSDCRVADVNWLKGLGETLHALRGENVKMVAPRTDNPGLGDDHQHGDQGASVPDVVLADGHLSLYCFLCHRELFGHVGGFLKAYPFGFYEDEEFAHRLRRSGYRQAVSGRSWVHHDGEATIRPLWRANPGARKVMLEDNRDRCVSDMRS